MEAKFCVFINCLIQRRLGLRYENLFFHYSKRLIWKKQIFWKSLIGSDFLNIESPLFLSLKKKNT